MFASHTCSRNYYMNCMASAVLARVLKVDQWHFQLFTAPFCSKEYCAIALALHCGLLSREALLLLLERCQLSLLRFGISGLYIGQHYLHTVCWCVSASSYACFVCVDTLFQVLLRRFHPQWSMSPPR